MAETVLQLVPQNGFAHGFGKLDGPAAAVAGEPSVGFDDQQIQVVVGVDVLAVGNGFFFGPAVFFGVDFCDFHRSLLVGFLISVYIV